ncbi:MAG TPA: hypothetical protein PL001_06370 [Candidatus Kryptobacter bacterium]|nr:hypothetical protein [Candidatus Kryptobacter bacterium]
MTVRAVFWRTLRSTQGKFRSLTAGIRSMVVDTDAAEVYPLLACRNERSQRDNDILHQSVSSPACQGGLLPLKTMNDDK